MIEKMVTKSGRMLKENGEYVNIADLLESIAEGATGDTKNLVEQLNRDVSALNARLNEGKFRLEIGAVADNSQNMLVSRKETFPHLWAIKQTNIRTEDQSRFNPHISPIGYLWYGAEDKNKNKVMFSSLKPDNDMVELFTWNTQIAYKGRGPSFYSAYITRNGDIICVYKGHRETEPENARQNPIVYPAGDYNNPVVVELDVKPTAWLQNCGADYIFPGTRNFFMFAEYTRPVHDKCRVWKVTPPFTNPSNWQIVMELDVTPGFMKLKRKKKLKDLHINI